MTAKERIVEYLNGAGRAAVRDIASALNLPVPSVRRNLCEMEMKRTVTPSFENGDNRTYWSVRPVTT